MVEIWIVDIEKQTMKSTPKKVDEVIFKTEEESLAYYQTHKRVGSPWTIHCYPRRVER